MAIIAIPIQKSAGKVFITKIPAITTQVDHIDENCTIGTNAERIFNGAYSRACCTAWPHSCAATAAAATLLLLYTLSLKFTVLVAGL